MRSASPAYIVSTDSHDLGVWGQGLLALPRFPTSHCPANSKIYLREINEAHEALVTLPEGTRLTPEVQRLAYPHRSYGLCAKASDAARLYAANTRSRHCLLAACELILSRVVWGVHLETGCPHALLDVGCFETCDARHGMQPHVPPADTQGDARTVVQRIKCVNLASRETRIYLNSHHTRLI